MKIAPILSKFKIFYEFSKRDWLEQKLQSLFHDEHLAQIGSAIRLFGEDQVKGYAAIPIIIYDLGMSEKQVEYVKNNDTFIYRRLDWDKFPDFIENLCTYSWKTIIWAETLAEFGSITWFDTSMNFLAPDRAQVKKITNKYAVGRSTSFLYYVHSAGHSISWATNADMFNYIPATINMMNERSNSTMPQANGVMLWNTIEMKNDILKWGLLCALTKYCIAPKTVWRKAGRVNKWCPKGGETKAYSYICHRYDQSLFSILVRNHYKYQEDRYQIQDEHEILGNPERTG